MSRRRIGHKPPSSKPLQRIGHKPPSFKPLQHTLCLDFYEDDVTNDNMDTAFRTIQPEVEEWKTLDNNERRISWQ